MPQLLFFFLRQVGIAQDVHNTAPLYNAVRAEHFRYRQDRGDLHDWNASLFEFGRDRSTGASTGPSRGGQNHSLHAVGLELLSNLPPQTAAIGDRVGEPRGRHKTVVQLAHHAGFLEFTQHVYRHQAVRVLLHIAGVIAPVRDFVVLAVPIIEARNAECSPPRVADR